LLDEHGVEYAYRDYRTEPLSGSEVRALLVGLGLTPADVLRKRDRAYRELGLTGSEPAEELISLIAEYPTLLERPIGVRGERAVLGRPPEKLLSLLDD
jgi:arsenate reductase